jgi:hypothetical protein
MCAFVLAPGALKGVRCWSQAQVALCVGDWHIVLEPGKPGGNHKRHSVLVACRMCCSLTHWVAITSGTMCW